MCCVKKKLVEKIKNGEGKNRRRQTRTQNFARSLRLPHNSLAVERVHRIQFCGAARRAESENYSDEN